MKKVPLNNNQVKAKFRNLRISPQKLNLVAQLIRGKTVENALKLLTFSKKRISLDVKKTLQSAVANAEHNMSLDIDSLLVKEAFVGKGLVMKRIRPRAKGRANRILKPFSHLTIIVESKES